MPDVIQLLPDAIANQIAAGEVVQRPASVVKELMENAIDAGSTSVKLIIKDAGSTLIQVIDDGCGMSETDARMSFERHATSKIRQASDLFSIHTMGFRGEALPSIAAIAQVEMKTRLRKQPLGTRLLIEGSRLLVQEAFQHPEGTSIAVKNLFYNVPARRNFLKSAAVELRHITDEFQRIALAHPDIFFSLHHNGTEMFHLSAGNLRQRIVSVFGAACNKKLIPVEEHTEVVRIQGFVSKPEFAKKMRGEQFFFVNKRFIKSNYLHHAVMTAYEELLPSDSYPLYVIFLEINPARIDVNVHPTKQEIKFDDERIVYNYMRVAIRRALGQSNATPSLDFDQDPLFSQMMDTLPTANAQIVTIPSKGNADFHATTHFPNKMEDWREKNNRQEWQRLYEGIKSSAEEETTPAPLTIGSEWEMANAGQGEKEWLPQHQKTYQLHATYIISQLKTGLMLIDQQAASERILFEKYLKQLDKQAVATQKLLFPKNIHVSPAEAPMLEEMLPFLQQLGFDLQIFGQDSFILHGVPAEMKSDQDEQKLLEKCLEQYKENVQFSPAIRQKIALSMAQSTSLKKGTHLSNEEMQALIDNLFACEMPYKSPSMKNCFITFDLQELEKKFKA